MVLGSSDEETGAISSLESMATSPQRSNRLHNFTLPSLKWGSQRYLRCTKSAGANVSRSRDRRSPSTRSDDLMANQKMELELERNQATNVRGFRMQKSQIDGGDSENNDGINEVRQKLVLDLKTAADRMKNAILRNDEEEENEEEQESSPVVMTAEVLRSWNLRTKREECQAPITAIGGSGKGLKIEKKPSYSSPIRTNDNDTMKLPNLRSNSEKVQQRVKFSVQLSQKEIEEDFMAMVGRPPPRRSIKRPKAVQKQVDTLFPGLWLTEVTADSYKVPEAPENGKVRKGKGKMHMSESDEES